MPAILAILLLFCLSTPAAETRPPNIVFILTDDLGISDLHCYGREEHRTPHLDQLARDGIRFTSAYCAQPICSPSRAALMTGKAPARLHLTTFLPGRADAPSQKLLHPQIVRGLPLPEDTLAEVLKEAGYVTACIGKWHLGGRGSLPTDHGFDLYHPGKANTTPSADEGGKGEYDLTRKAEEFIEANRERPFFLFLSHNTPHIPYTARPELIAKNSQALEPVYAALIETMDDAVGQLLAKIDAPGLRTNTIVIFTSDNGGLHVPELKHEKITHNAPFRAGKGYLYEGGLRIPLIVRWPGQIPAGKVEPTPVINTDWLPTLAEFAGTKAPPNLDGKSIAPLLLGQQHPPARPLFWHFPHYSNQGGQPGGAVRDADWKLIEHYENGARELFNLRNDPGETQDLSTSEPSRTERMASALKVWRQSIGAQENQPNPAFDPNLHRPLYLDFDSSRYDPRQQDSENTRQVLEWRRLMDDAVRR